MFREWFCYAFVERTTSQSVESLCSIGVYNLLVGNTCQFKGYIGYKSALITE